MSESIFSGAVDWLGKTQATHILEHFGQNTSFAFAMLDKKAESAEK